MDKNRTGKIIVILVLVIIILLGILAYFFVIKPSINGYVIKTQNEAKDVVLSSILYQIQQQGFVTITDQAGNSIILAPVQQPASTK
jgi:uncharacterized protein (UPF0333 family)